MARSRANSRARCATDSATVPIAVKTATMAATPPKEPPSAMSISSASASAGVLDGPAVVTDVHLGAVPESVRHLGLEGRGRHSVLREDSDGVDAAGVPRDAYGFGVGEPRGRALRLREAGDAEGAGAVGRGEGDARTHRAFREDDFAFPGSLPRCQPLAGEGGGAPAVGGDLLTRTRLDGEGHIHDRRPRPGRRTGLLHEGVVQPGLVRDRHGLVLTVVSAAGDEVGALVGGGDHGGARRSGRAEPRRAGRSPGGCRRPRRSARPWRARRTCPRRLRA